MPPRSGKIARKPEIPAHEPSLQLPEAVTELYRIFRPYRTPVHPVGCPCCVTQADQQQLFAKPLERLSVGDLDQFAFQALTTWGSVNDLKHFLPRLLELGPESPEEFTQVEVLFRKLTLGDWSSWPLGEHQAVTHFLLALWRERLTAVGGEWKFDELLCGLGCAVDSLAPYLRLWSDCRHPSGYDHLVHFIDENSAGMLKRRSLANAFWSDVPAREEELVNWLADPTTLRGLEQTFSENPSAAYADALARAIDRLTALQTVLKPEPGASVTLES